MNKTEDFAYVVNKWLRKLFPMQQFSNVCDKCNGDGGFERGSGYDWPEFEDCPKCCDFMICPSCGSQLSEDDAADLFRGRGICPFCRWDTMWGGPWSPPETQVVD